ncbi:hypothetical protein ACQKWADRAFT_282877 [Trichoderma austrokoningii]
MVLALLILVLAGGVAAQHLTLPLVDYGAVVNAVNPNDPGYQICTEVAEFVSGCVDKIGGPAALSTANPIAVAECACCVGTTDVAPAYSSCANYLISEAPQLSSQISAYGYFYSACGSSPQICLGNSGGKSGGNSEGGGSVTVQSVPSSIASSSRFQSAVPTSAPSPASSPSKIPQQTSATGGGSTASTTTDSAASAVTTFASACIRMEEIFEECTKNTPGFTALVYSEQAHCYCCRTALGGEVTWTDEIDTYASTCRDWAVTITTGEPLTAYDVAKTFATFCKHFSDACAVTTNGPSSSTNDNPFPPPDSTGGSGDSSAGGDGGQVTVTVAQPPASTSHNAAPTVRAGLAAGAFAVAGFAIMV